MRKAILAFALVAVVVAAAQPASAFDDGFRGNYVLHAREKAGTTCPDWSFQRDVDVTYVNDAVRTVDPVHSRVGEQWRLRYVTKARFPWQDSELGLVSLRYKPDTDSAIGHMRRIQSDCRWHVRLVPAQHKGVNLSPGQRYS